MGVVLDQLTIHIPQPASVDDPTSRPVERLDILEQRDPLVVVGSKESRHAEGKLECQLIGRTNQCL